MRARYFFASFQKLVDVFHAGSDSGGLGLIGRRSSHTHANRFDHNSSAPDEAGAVHNAILAVRKCVKQITPVVDHDLRRSLLLQMFRRLLPGMRPDESRIRYQRAVARRDVGWCSAELNGPSVDGLAVISLAEGKWAWDLAPPPTGGPRGVVEARGLVCPLG